MTSVEILVKSIYDGLSVVERRVADFFLENPQDIFNYPIATLAEKSGTSSGAWVRFSKSLGFDGLKSLKKHLLMELSDQRIALSEQERMRSKDFSDICGIDNVTTICNTVKNTSIKSIEDTVQIIDLNTIERIAQLTIDARSVRLFGVGASALVADDFACKLLRIGKNVSFCRDSHVQLTYASTCAPTDIAIFFSNSGRSKEAIEAVRLSKAVGCPTVAITQYRHSSLAELCDYRIFTASSEVYIRSGAMSSRISQLIIIDILFTTIANMDYANIRHNLESSYISCSKFKENIKLKSRLSS